MTVDGKVVLNKHDPEVKQGNRDMSGDLQQLLCTRLAVEGKKLVGRECNQRQGLLEKANSTGLCFVHV